MKKITITLAALMEITGTAYGAWDTSTRIDGVHLSSCTSKYIDVNAIESLNYEDNAWKLVMGRENGWGGSSCTLTMTEECSKALIGIMGREDFDDASIEGTLTSNILCACNSNSDCVTGFKCSSAGSGQKYGFCTQISNFCTTDSQCDNDKGYVCVNKACTQKCTINTKPDDTGWKIAARDTSDYYNFPMIEKSSTYKCSSAGRWTGTTAYRCAAHYYGAPTSANSKCTRCPSYPGPAEAPAGSTKITDCYYPRGTEYNDSTGAFKIIGGDCHHD